MKRILSDWTRDRLDNTEQDVSFLDVIKQTRTEH